MRQGRLVPVDPAGAPIRFQWNPETLQRTPRQPRRRTLDRPDRVSALQWQGVQPEEVSFTLRLDRLGDQQPVTDEVDRLEGLLGDTEQPPPKVRLVYDRHAARRYMVTSVTPQQGEIRNEQLQIVRVEVAVTLTEWIEAKPIRAPADRQRSQQRRDRGGDDREPTIHTVSSGETLWGIAEQHLGDGQRYTEIVEANDLADPDLIQPGDRLRIPRR